MLLYELVMVTYATVAACAGDGAASMVTAATAVATATPASRRKR
jgi:hypothetical protein